MKREMHKYSCEVAILARCAGQYGMFWKYHDLVFSRQNEINNKNNRLWAKEIGLTDEQIDSCLDSKDMINKMKSDVELGNKLGVNATPTLFFNGKQFIGRLSLESMSREVDAILND